MMTIYIFCVNYPFNVIIFIIIIILMKLYSK